MTESTPLPALREFMRAAASVPLDLPVAVFARARTHLDAIERALADARKIPGTIESTQRAIDALETSTLSHWRHLHDLTGRPGYRMLDRLAQRVRRPERPDQHPERVHSPTPPDRQPEPPIAVAVVETRELLAAVTQLTGDTDTLSQTAVRAQHELGRITPELTSAQAQQRELDDLTARLRAAQERLADLQDKVHAVRRRVSSRLLNALHVPARTKHELPEVPAPQGEPPPLGWPQLPPEPRGGQAVLSHLDLPEPPAVVLEGEAIALIGWAFTPQAPVSRIDVLLDGEPIGRARLGHVRTDVHEHYSIPHSLLCGFDFRLDPALVQGRVFVDVEVVAQTLQGSRSLVAARRVWVARALDRPIDVDSNAHITLPSAAAKTPNLLVVTHDLGYGGGQLWLTELLDRMGAGRDFPATVVAPHWGPLAPALRRLGIAVHVNGGIPTSRADSYEGRLEESAAWAAPQGFTHVLVNTFLAFPGADLAVRLALPCVWAIHESWPPGLFWSVAYPPGAIDRQVRHAALRALASTGAVVFEADSTRALYADHTRPGAATVVRYGVRTRAIRDYCAAVDRESARKMLGLTGFRRVVLVMGTVEPRKGQTILAVAFQQIAHEHPDTALVFVGAGDTPYTHGLTEYLGLIGLNQQVRVEALVADSNPWYRAADALVCASDVESLPRSALEAMAFGLPVSSTAVFGLPELLTDGETGLLFEPSDIGAAVEALERLLAMSPPQLSRIAAAGRQHVFDHYDSAGYAEHLRKLFLAPAGDSLAGAR